MKKGILLIILVFASAFVFGKEKKIYVRYGWQAFTRANLVNSSGLPASTFKTSNENNDNNMNKAIERLVDFPIEGGISAPFVGIHGDKLIVAGGCNFPNAPASQGGKKEFYDDIFYLDILCPDKGWKKSEIPYKVAYGSSIITEDGIICIGGQNDTGAITNVVRIHFENKTEKITVENWPSLPAGIYNAGATVVENTIYLAGGTSSEKKTNYIYCLDMDNLSKGWYRIETNQAEERQQAVVFTQNGNLFIAGGYDEANAHVFSDVLKFDFSDNNWQHFTDIVINGKQQTFIGTGCINLSANCTLFAGGVDYDLFSSALLRIKKKQEAIANGNTELADSLQAAGKEYMSQPIEWYNFNTNLLSFDTKKKEWKSEGNFIELAKAGAGITIKEKNIYIVCGELKPGVRTQEVYKLTLN
ncbi:cyclically-permuted mutarotase family protein [Bacteroidales bacterium OttesenSCG-928-M11]|nr:cyclically-permuted mutarotase family protein [Bacteroidales bacterium OttesenSCG-928-M11]